MNRPPLTRGAALLVLVALVATPVRAADPVRPESVGLSTAGLERVTAYLQSEVDAGRIAGAVGLVARHGHVASIEPVGFSDLATRRRMESTTLFRIASMTKAVTSVAVMTLVEDGALRLDDPLEKFLPAFRELRVLAPAGSVDRDARLVPSSRSVTIHDLLTHTSGITYGWSGPEALDRRYAGAKLESFLPTDETVADHVARLARLPLKFQPGAAWDYGLSLDVLGHVCEIVSGLTLEQLFRERIFRPLGMRETWFHVPRKERHRLATLYTVDDQDERRRLRPVRDGEPVTRGFLRFSSDFCTAGGGLFHSGGAGLVSSITDYSRFLHMLLAGGSLDGTRILRRDTVARMTRNQIGDLVIAPWGHGDGFGYGFGVLTPRGTGADTASAGTFSWGGIFNTYYWVDPQLELVGILMTQIFPFDHLETRSEFKRLVHEAVDDSGFARLRWYEPGAEHANPFFNSRQLRVNAPEVSIHPTFSKRSEPRSSGLARILVEEDLTSIRRASLYCELWGGHPGTANKRVSINGRRTLHFPEVGTAAGHCTHQYHGFNLQATDLVRGHNALQFACDSGSSFWGHFIVDNAALKIGLAADHPDVVEAGLGEFTARVEATTLADDAIRLRLVTGDPTKIATVHFQGRHEGYDENGNGRRCDWHGMTKGREPLGLLGSASEPPFELRWSTSMLPAQRAVAVRARVTFEGSDLVWDTPVTDGLEIPERPEAGVTIHHVTDLPPHFWSRAGKKQTAVIDLDIDPASIEAAELRVVTWTGGPGSVENYFTLNGTHFPVAEGSDHEVVFSTIPVDPSLLRRGANRIEVLSDTTHHGIEVLRPGPALVVRSRRSTGD